MEITKLSNTGQINIPQVLREYYHWEDGQELRIVNVGDGILIKSKKVFPEIRLDDVAGCLHYQGEPKTIDEMEQAIQAGIKEFQKPNFQEK